MPPLPLSPTITGSSSALLAAALVAAAAEVEVEVWSFRAEFSAMYFTSLLGSMLMSMVSAGAPIGQIFWKMT